MGAKYSVILQRTAHASQSLGNITAPGSGMRRGRIYFAQFGCEGDAADNEFRWVMQRCTTAGTRTGKTPKPLDMADAACAMTAGQNHSAEPTYTADEIPLDTPLNQRATYQWMAPPGGEIVIPATANAGVGFATPTMTALAITAAIHFEE